MASYPHVDEHEVRRDLAAALRWAARLELHEAVANHFSAAISPDGRRFLVNPPNRHFSRITASSLRRLDASSAGTPEAPRDVDPTAWYLHAHLHQRVPRARAVLHTHMPYATALACLDGFELLMLDQNACRFHERIAYDREYAGMALDDGEGERVARLLGDRHTVVFLGNHGVIVIGDSVAHAFDELYYLERAAKLQVLALSTGRPLSPVPDHLVAIVEKQWREYPDVMDAHLHELRAILDAEEPDYAT